LRLDVDAAGAEAEARVASVEQEDCARGSVRYAVLDDEFSVRLAAYAGLEIELRLLR
jgi:hypothetical protein